MFGWFPRSLSSRKSVTSRFNERTRSAWKQNLNTRRSFNFSCRPSQTSPKPPSPNSRSSTQPVLGTTCPTAGRQPSTGSLSAEICRRAFSESGGRDRTDKPTSHISIGSSTPLTR